MVDYVKMPDEEEDNRPKSRKPRFSWGKAILIAIGVFVFLSLVSSVSYMITPKLAVVPISGMIMTESDTSLFTGTTQSSRDIAEKLYELKEDNSVEAILLDIDSPGGSAVASEEIAKAVEEVSEVKPVYALINDVGASGGFWIAVSADKVYASPMSMVGSIGATSATLSFEGFIDDFNITYRDLTSAPYKDIGSPFREMEEDEKEIIQGLLDELHQNFINHVKENRNLTYEELEPYAQGQVYLGTTAKEGKLIDELGYYPDVIEELKGDRDLLVVRHQTSTPSLFNIGGISSNNQYTPIASNTPMWFLS